MPRLHTRFNNDYHDKLRHWQRPDTGLPDQFDVVKSDKTHASCIVVNIERNST